MRRRVLLTAALAFAATRVGAQGTCARPSGGDAATAGVFAATNLFRQQNGRAALTVSAALKQAAQAQACHMARTGRMSHEGAGGSTVGERARAAGYRWRFIAENVAEGHPTAAAVMDGWQGSRGHRQNMLSERATEIGIGLAERDGRRYWAMVLGAPLG